MFPIFGILQPRTGPEESSTEAPRKKSFFGGPVVPPVGVAAAEQDALGPAGKHPEPERLDGFSAVSSGHSVAE